MVVTSVNDSTTGRDESENIITPSMNNQKDNANEIDLQLKEVSSGSPSVDNTPVEWSSFRGVKDGASNAPSSNSASLPIVQTPMMRSASSLSASSKVSHKESSIDTDDIDSSNGKTSNTNRNELNTIVSSSMPSFATTTATSSEAKSTEGLLNAQSSSDLERSGGSNQKDELSVSSNQPNAVSLATTATAISITTTAVTPVHPPRRQLFPPNTAPATSANANARNTYLKQPNTISDSNNNNNTGNSNNQNKTAFDAFGDFLTVFFRKAEVYEEELERRQSQRELLLKREDSGDEGDAVNTSFKKNLSSPRLSPTMEAMAAVEAMSSFRSLKEVKIELKESQSFDQEGGQQNKKKRKTSESNLQDVATEEKLQPLLSENAKLVDNLIPAEDESMKNEWAEQWKQFCEEKKKNKFKEVAIQVHTTLFVALTLLKSFHYNFFTLVCLWFFVFR